MSIEWRSTVAASNENMWSSFGITARALVVLTNSTSNHRECLHMTTRRYSPVLIGPQKSMATSFQGSLDNGDILQWLVLICWCHYLTWVAVLNVGFHHLVQTWKPDPSPEIFLCFCNPLMSFISEPDYFVLSDPGSTMQDPHPTNPRLHNHCPDVLLKHFFFFTNSDLCLVYYPGILHREWFWVPGVAICSISPCLCFLSRYIIELVIKPLQANSHSFNSK